MRSERRSPAPSGQGEEEDRFDKVAASPNSKFLTARSISQELPSFLNPDDPEGSFEQYYNERKEKYEAISAISIDLETKTQDQVVLELCALILNLEK